MSKAKAKTVKTAGNERADSSHDFKSLFYQKLTETRLFYEVAKIIASELEPSELVLKIMKLAQKTTVRQNEIGVGRIENCFCNFR